jgi:chitinase
VSLTNPVNGQVFTPAGDITLQASASDPGGNVAKVEFYQGSTKLGEKLTAPYSLIWSNVPAGKFHLSARAIDNLGGVTDSSQIAITVAGRPQLANSAGSAAAFPLHPARRCRLHASSQSSNH